MKFASALVVLMAALMAMMMLPIVRAKNGHECPEGYKRPPCKQPPCNKPCERVVHHCHSSVCSTVTQTFAPVTVTQTNCCTPFETVSEFPSMLCSTVVMCGATDAACAGERVSRFNKVASEMILDTAKAQVYINNILTTIAGTGAAVITSGSSVITVQGANAAVGRSGSNSLLGMAIAGLAGLFALVVLA